jgi:hypothetical protein
MIEPIEIRNPILFWIDNALPTSSGEQAFEEIAEN